MSQILPYANPEWEKLSIFLNFLTPKLPAPEEEDLSLGILEAVDMDTYRTEKQATVRIALDDDDAEIDSIQVQRGGGMPDPQLQFLSLILDEFNRTWGNRFTNPEHITDTLAAIPDRVSADAAYQNAQMHSDRQNAQIECDAALLKEVTATLNDGTELYKMFTEDPDFKQYLSRVVFAATYLKSSGSAEPTV